MEHFREKTEEKCSVVAGEAATVFARGDFEAHIRRDGLVAFDFEQLVLFPKLSHRARPADVEVIAKRYRIQE